MVARLARDEGVPWPIHIDQFDLLGRVDRSGSRQPIWVYRHRESGGDIFADPSGQTYRYRPTPKAAAAGRFERCDAPESIHLAGLPEVVEPVGERRGPRRGAVVVGRTCDGTAMAAHPTAQARRSCRPARSRVPASGSLAAPRSGAAGLIRRRAYGVARQRNAAAKTGN